MPNITVRAAAEGLPSITRRLFLRNTAAASMATAAVAASSASVQGEPALTPDERINAALEEIKDALLERNPDTSCRICRIGHDGEPYDTFMVIANLSFLKPGEVQYQDNGKVVRREGGAV